MAKGGYQKRRIAEKKAAERAARKRAAQRKKLLTGASVVAAVAVLSLIAITVFTGSDEPSLVSGNPGCDTQGAAGTPKEPYAAQPEDALVDGVDYSATFVTSCGAMTVDLLEEDAPLAVGNFVSLARDGFYDGTVFHRVIPEFAGSAMIQGGDGVNGDGTGSPGYAFKDENMIPFDQPGYLAMANSGPASNGSQFFFLNGMVTHLNAAGACSPKGGQGCHSVFGTVTDGIDVIGKIALVERAPNDRPLQDVVLISVTINEQPA